MTTNPFESPASTDVARALSDDGHRFLSLELRSYRSPLQRGSWTIVTCILSVALLTMLCTAAYAQFRMHERIQNGEEVSEESVHRFERTFDMLATFSAYSALFASIVFLFWLFRTSKNLRAISYECPAFTPGWTIGCWFVPIANLIWPYRAIVEVWRLSDPNANVSPLPDDSSPINPPPPVSFRIWWAAWLLYGSLTFTLLFVEQIEASWGVKAALAILFIRLAFAVLETMFGCSIVVQINRRQVHRFKNLKAALGTPSAPAT